MHSFSVSSSLQGSLLSFSLLTSIFIQSSKPGHLGSPACYNSVAYIFYVSSIHNNRAEERLLLSIGCWETCGKCASSLFISLSLSLYLSLSYLFVCQLHYDVHSDQYFTPRPGCIPVRSVCGSSTFAARVWQWWHVSAYMYMYLC